MNRIPGLCSYVTSPDFLSFLQVSENAAKAIRYHFLAQGEYNCNYDFIHPVTGQHLVLRINFGSQMHLKDQITYEYKALQLLAGSGRTPHVYYADDSKRLLPYGVLVMEFLKGKPLNYEQDLPSAAACLADIHSLRLPAGHSLLTAEEPLHAILSECREMFSVYEHSHLADPVKTKWIKSLLKKGAELLRKDSSPPPQLCCINTELNNTNFLVEESGFSHLIDWEKPLLGDPAQDLGHFLAPTTTFWKTDIFLTPSQIRDFLKLYIAKTDNRYPVGDLEQRVSVYLPITCLRGITWCAMAWVEYQQPDRVLKNESTWKKLNQYLSDEYLTKIETEFL